MSSKKIYGRYALGLLAGVTLVGLSAPLSVQAASRAAVEKNAPLTTPLGITLQPLGKAQGYVLDKETASYPPRDQIVFTDARGLTLYTYDLDEPGKSNCVDACNEKWKPVPVLANAKAFGDWSIITRADGVKQWALRGQPLYTYVEDVDPGSIWGNSPGRFGAARVDGSGGMMGGGSRGNLRGTKVKPDLPVPKNWQAAFSYPVQNVVLPPNMGIKETFDAQAVTLVDYRGRTLYTYDGNPADLAKMSTRVWIPAEAPQMAFAGGEFGSVQRADGIKQWTFKGKPLFTYAEDIQEGNAYGEGVDGKWHAAALTKFYMPDGVTMQRTLGFGKVMATSKGQTLYKREGYINQSGGGYSFRDGNPNRPAVGRDLGTDPRCGDCGGKWRPFLAPAHAEPQGYWDVYKRPDGSKQWAYKGFALWTYDGDDKPGDMNGHSAADVVVSLDPNVVVGVASRVALENPAFKVRDVGTPQDNAAMLMWNIVLP